MTSADALGRNGSQRAGVTAGRVLAAEWTKVAGLASTGWLLVGTVAAAGSLVVVLGLFAGPGDAVSATSLVTSGYLLAQLGVLVLGVLVGSGDFATGTVLTTYAAVPRRLPVLGAQLVVTAALALVTASAALAVSVAVCLAAGTLSHGPSEGVDRRAAAGYVLFLAGVALCGVLLGSLLRGAVAALTTGVALFVLLDRVLAANPGRVADTVRALLPSGGTRLFADDDRLAALAAGPGPHLGAADGGAGGVVLGGWCLLLLLLAGYRLLRRDLT